MKSFSIQSVIAKSALFMSVVATSVQANDSFKLAIIEGTPAAGKILKGDYQQSKTQLEAAKASERIDDFEGAMSQCVVNIKLKELNKAQSWCDKAVLLVENAPEYRTHLAKFKSLALNNRAIIKYLQDDNLGAYRDFKQALSLHQSAMVKSNQWQFTQAYMADSLAAK